MEVAAANMRPVDKRKQKRLNRKNGQSAKIQTEVLECKKDIEVSENNHNIEKN